MVSKVFPGDSFYHACRYVVNKPGAEVLEYEGVRGHDYRLMSDDFIMQQQLRPEKKKACFHCSLSFYPGEVLSDELMVKIAKKYLYKLGINNTQFTITKHTDRRHMHLHVVANMVDNNGKAISDSFLGLRGKKIAQQLTKEYSLVQALGKNLELTNHEALRTSQANKYKIYKAIMEALPHCKTMQDLEKKLQLQGIGTQYKYRGQSLEKQGVSFKIGEDCFKGSKVDRQFSLSNLEKTLGQTQKQFSQLKLKAARNDSQCLLPKRQTTASIIGEHPGKEIEKGMEKMAEVLLKPEETFQQMPRELLQENKKKKKKLSGNQNRGQHH